MSKILRLFLGGDIAYFRIKGELYPKIKFVLFEKHLK